MNFFNNPLTAEQFHNAVKMVQETSNLVATHNASNPDNSITNRTLRNYFSEREYWKLSEVAKANVMMCMTEDDVKLYNEARKAVDTVKEYAEDLRNTGKGLLAAIQGNSEARRTRLWVDSLKRHLEVADQFTAAISELDYNFGDLDPDTRHKFPTLQQVKELGINNRANCEGIKWETEKLLESVAKAANAIVSALRGLPFPENSKADLLEDANALVGDGTPRIYGDNMVAALNKAMLSLTPKGCLVADLGQPWERPEKELAAFDALRACVTLDERDAQRVTEWHANLLEWIEKRVQVAQG